MPGADVFAAAPRAVSFARRARRPDDSAEDASAIPAAPPGAAFVAAAMLDELMVVMLRAGRRQPTAADIQRIAEELTVAVELFDGEGWLDDPRAFHRPPPAPTDVTVAPATSRGVTFERISFDSGFEPESRIPGSDRWLAHERNRRARAWVVRGAPGVSRPWVVHLHPFSTGTAADVRLFRSVGYRDPRRRRDPAGVPAARGAPVPVGAAVTAPSASTP